MKKSIIRNYIMVFVGVILAVSPVSIVMAEISMVEIDWQNTFGGPEWDSAGKLIQTTDGGFAILGTTQSYGAGLYDMWLLKTNANGQLEWNSTFGGDKFDEPSTLIQTFDGGYALSGHSQEPLDEGGFYQEVWLIKTDNTGVQEWNYTNEGVGYVSTVIQTADGGFILAADIGPSGERIPKIIKFDVNGNQEWNQTVEDSGIACIQTLDGGFAMVGGTGEYPNSDFLLTKTNATGYFEWNKTYSRVNWDIAHFIFQLADGSFVLVGDTGEGGIASFVWILKTDINGQAIWNRTLEFRLNSVCHTNDGGFMFASDKYNMYTGDSFFFTKTNATIQIEWQKALGTDLSDSVGTVIQASDGEYVAVGTTGKTDDTTKDILLMKTKTVEVTSTTSTTTTTTTTDTPGFSFLILLVLLPGLVYFVRRKRR